MGKSIGVSDSSLKVSRRFWKQGTPLCRMKEPLLEPGANLTKTALREGRAVRWSQILLRTKLGPFVVLVVSLVLIFLAILFASGSAVISVTAVGVLLCSATYGFYVGLSRSTPPLSGVVISMGPSADVSTQATSVLSEQLSAIDDGTTDGIQKNTLTFTVNGAEQVIVHPSPSLLLVDYLRDTLGLTGTKIGCGEGGCGACSCVAVGPDGVPRAINSCLRLLCACDGLEILTVEAFGSQASGFSEAQKAIAQGQGSQCGFCTPGWVVAMEAMLARSRSTLPGQPKLTSKFIETSLDGNLCRCTGYRPILQAFKSAFADDTPDIEDLATCPRRLCSLPCAENSDTRNSDKPPHLSNQAHPCLECPHPHTDRQHDTPPCLLKSTKKEEMKKNEKCRDRPPPSRRAERCTDARYTDAGNALAYYKPHSLAALRKVYVRYSYK